MRTGTRRTRSRLAGLAIAAGLLAVAACGGHSGGQSSDGAAGGGAASGGEQAMAGQQAAAGNPDLDPGTSLHGAPAPDFRLTNQFGQPISLSSFRGKVVIIAFTDSECTTVCPLTTASMVAAKDLLGRAGSQVQLLGIDANPKAAARANVMAYSRSHGMVNQWQFLTGSLPQLRAVWKSYHIDVQVMKDEIDHTPALFVIDTHGREQRLYLTEMAYASIGQAGQLLAQEASRLLPGHPKLRSQQSLAQVKGITPKDRTRVPSATSGSISLGPGRPRLVMFFATWLGETSPLADRLAGLNEYARAARRDKLPPLVAMDEAASEPSSATARSYLAQLARQGKRLSYPVGLDTSGRIADGYGVEDQPWFALVSASGKIIWRHAGWLPVAALEAAARRA